MAKKKDQFMAPLPEGLRDRVIDRAVQHDFDKQMLSRRGPKMTNKMLVNRIAGGGPLTPRGKDNLKALRKLLG